MRSQQNTLFLLSDASVSQSRQREGELSVGKRFMNGVSGIPSYNMKKTRVPKKDDVVGVLGHKGTFQVLSVDSRNGVVDLRSLEKRHVPAEVLEGVPWTLLLYLPQPKKSSSR
jgi:hypothetical protein